MGELGACVCVVSGQSFHRGSGVCCSCGVHAEGGGQCCPCDPEGSPRRRIWACQSLLRAVLPCMVAVGAAVVVVVEVSVVCLGSPRLLLRPGRRAVPMGPLPGRMVPGSRACVGTAVAGSVGGDRQVSPLGVVGVGGGRSHQVATVVLVGLPAGLERLAVLAGSVRPLVPPCRESGGSASVLEVRHW